MGRGAYENLGLEALFKPRSGLIGCDTLIVSDASAQLSELGHSQPKRSPFAILKGELHSPRLFDIASDQIRGLRSRIFVSELERGDISGALLKMGNSVRAIDLKDRTSRASYDAFLGSDDVAKALSHPTGLKAVPPSIFDVIARHGYEIAGATLVRRLPDAFRKDLTWSPS